MTKGSLMMHETISFPARTALLLPLSLASMVTLAPIEAAAQTAVPIQVPSAVRKVDDRPPPVTESERQFRDIGDYVRTRGELDASTRADLARIAQRLDEDLAKPGNTIDVNVRLLAARVQAALWLDDRDAINQNFARLAAFRADKEPVYLAWARELVARAEFEAAHRILAEQKFSEPRLVDSQLLLARCLMAENRFDEAQATLNSAPMKRSQSQMSEIGQLTGRITALRELWNAEQVAMAKDQARGDLPLVEFVTSKGAITVELFEDQAPNTVGNFIEHVEAGTYNGTRFHRALRGMGIQGGDPATANGGTGGRSSGGWTIPDETLSDSRRAPLLGRLITVLQPDAANPQNPAPNSGGCQFMVLVSHAEDLLGKHTTFGRISDGLDVVARLTTDDTIVSAQVVRKRSHRYAGVRFSTDATGDFSMPRAMGLATRSLETKVEKQPPMMAPTGAPAAPRAPGTPAIQPMPIPRGPDGRPLLPAKLPDQLSPTAPGSPSAPPPLLTPTPVQPSSAPAQPK